MPVHWTISHASKLVVAVAKDEVTVSDVERYFAAITADGAMTYRKLFEIADTPMTVSAETLKTLSSRVVFYSQHGQLGPLAIVATSDAGYAQAKRFADAAQARRPLAIFREPHAAREWLETQPIPED